MQLRRSERRYSRHREGEVKQLGSQRQQKQYAFYTHN